jgi:hypothetical protein
MAGCCCSVLTGVVPKWFGAAASLCLALSMTAQTQPSRHTILTNGPSAQRINLVVFAEGYTTNQFAKFLGDATNAVNHLLAAGPYSEYRSYLNAFAIWAPSAESGSTHPVYGQFRNTYFNSAYDTNANYVITIPPNYRNTNYSHGRGKIDALLQGLMPDYSTNRDVSMILVNDPVAGGSGGSLLIASVSAYLPEILVHESGHTFANLSDEYSDPYVGGDIFGEGPNATMQTNRALIKWNAWIDPATPIPTPANYSTTAIGLFEGANYQATGWYRPKFDCGMRTLGVAFCEVCNEALVKSFYERVRPVESFAPPSTNFSAATSAPIEFSVMPLQPLTQSLIIQWSVNGAPVTGGTNPVYTLFPASLSNGTHTVLATVHDATLWVRNDPAQVLSQTVEWSVNIGLPELRLDSARWLNGSDFVFRVSGTAPEGFVIQASTNLNQWTVLATNALSGGQFYFTNYGAATAPRRFYRAAANP